VTEQEKQELEYQIEEWTYSSDPEKGKRIADLKRQIQNAPKYRLVSAKEIYNTEFAPLNWVVPQIFPEGLSKLDGPPKAGKSWFVLSLCLSVSMGGSFLGHIPVERRGVVYLALEDSKRRLNHRMHKIGIEPPENFFVMTPAEWQGTIADFEKLLQEHKNIGLAVIDTLHMFSPMQDSNSYVDTYGPVSRIQRISHSANTAVLLTHHTRKTQKDGGSWADSGMGSQGINGAVDTIVLLDKKDGSQEGTLRIRGRDVMETAYKIKWDKTLCSWELIGETSLVETTPTLRDDILELLTKNPEGLRNKDLCVFTGKDKSVVSRSTADLIQQGKITKTNDLFKLTVDNTLYGEKSTTVCNTELAVNSYQHQLPTVVDETDTRGKSTVNSEKELDIY